MASFTTFGDDFTAPTLNGRWETNGDGTFITGGTADISTNSKSFGFSGLSSAASYDMTNTGVWVQVISTDATTNSLSTFGAASQALSGGYDELSWSFDGANNAWQAWSPGSGHGHAPAGTAMWLRIFNVGGSGGSITWDYSVNGINWTNVYTSTMAAITSENFGTAFPLTAAYWNAYVTIQSISFADFVIDNANITPTAPAANGGFLMFL